MSVGLRGLTEPPCTRCIAGRACVLLVRSVSSSGHGEGGELEAQVREPRVGSVH